MKVTDCLEEAHTEIKKDNLVEGLKIFEEGCRIFNDSRILETMKQVKMSIRHLESKEAYIAFYKDRQGEGSTPKLFAGFERKIRTWTGKRTRKLIKTFPQNVRYQQVERDIRKGVFKSILDCGCHEGRFSVCLGAKNPTINVAGIDVAQVNIDKADELNNFKNVCFKQGFAEDVHQIFKPDSFDFVMLFEILEHVISVEEVIASVFKVLKEDGMVAITVPEGFKNQTDLKEHVRYFSDQLITKLFSHRKGFRHVKILPRPDEPEFSKGCYWNYITFLK